MRSLWTSTMFAGASFFFSKSVSALELKGVTLAEEIVVHEKTLKLNGAGLSQATFLHLDVYVAGLYLQSETHSAAEVLKATPPKAVEMEFLRTIKKETIAQSWKEGLEKNCAPHCAKLKSSFATFYKLMESVKPGERMRFVVKDEGTEIYIREELKGEVLGKDFNQALMQVWFGPNPPNLKLQHGMLGIK